MPARERLHRQLEWLRRNYAPITPLEAVFHLERGTLPPYSLVVTTDDARRDLLDMSDIFQEHEVPLAVFPCVGWVESNTPVDGLPSLSRVIDFMRWYQGPEQRVELVGNTVLMLDAKSVDRTIDHVISKSQALGPEFVASAWDVLARLPRHAKPEPPSVCNWSEITELARRGMLIGSHSVTHCRMAKCSDIRLAFELEESKRVVEAQIAPCEMFAYPFGTDDVASPRTAEAVRKAGYRCAFLSHHDFAPVHSDLCCLPRIVIPDEEWVDLGLFRAFVLGGNIPWHRAKKAILGGHARCEQAVLAASFLSDLADFAV